MADITPYGDQITPELGPNIGTDAMISAARRVGPLEREAGLMEQQGATAIGQAAKDVFGQREAVQTRREVASKVESHALIQGQQEADLNRLFNDPELSKDPNKLQAALQNFKDTVIDPENAEWLKGFTTQAGQEWGQLHAAQQSAELLKHGFSMADIISSNEAITSAFNAANQYAANAIANPMTIDQQIASYRSGVQGIAGTISDPVKRAEFEKAMRKSEGDIAYAGVHAAIENSPPLGRQLAKKHGDIMTPEQQTAAEGYAVATEKANAQQARINASLDRQAAREAGEDQGKQILLSMRDANGNPTVPSDFMQQMTRAAATGMSVGTFRSLMDEKDRILTEIARGTPTPDNPAVYSDFQRRLSLDPADPQAPTLLEVDQARNAGQLSTKSADNIRQSIEDMGKNPALKAEQGELTKFLNSNKPDIATQQDNQAWFVFEKDRTQKYWDARRAGIPARDLLDPTSKYFLGNITDAEKANTAVSPAQQANPASAAQKQASIAADTAIAVASLLRDNNPDLARKTLEQYGIKDPNVENGTWGAPLVNGVLKAAGLQGTGSDLASSFLTSPNLFPVSATNVQKGDIFYASTKGGAGTVGIVTGAVRTGPHGEPQVQVVSTGAGDGGRQALTEISQYARGNAAAGGPSPVSRIDPGFAGDISRMVQAMPPNIRSQFTIESGFRSPEREAQVYAEQHPGQAVPADSAHSHGLAVDIGKNGAVIGWITQHGSEYGVHFPLAGQPGEENHLEPISGGHGAPPTSGGVEWRDVQDMVFRRAKPSLDDIRPQTYLDQAWGAIKSGVRSLSPNGE